MRLSRGDFPLLDEEKGLSVELSQTQHKYSPSASSVSSDGNFSVVDVPDVPDAEKVETSVRSSWQTFYQPETLPPLVPKTGSHWYRLLRWTVLTTYRRLFAFCFLANAAALVALGASNTISTPHTATAAAINLTIAILARQEHVVNALFVTTSAVPVSWPLWFRRHVAKIYCYGGWHSGCSIAAFVWYAVFVGYATSDYCRGMSSMLATMVLGYILVAVLVLIIAFAHPTLRMKFHDRFELTHRFAGYTAVGIFWAQIILLAHASRSSHSTGHNLIHTPAFWCLIIITACIIYPWIRLRRRLVRFQYLSTHAVCLHFTHTSLDYCVGVRLTTNPLFETHAFATIPNKPGDGPGFSVIISNAGDWTSNLIKSSKPVSATEANDSRIEPLVGDAPVVRPGPCRPGQHHSSHSGQDVMGYIYTKGVPIYGVLRVATIFRKPVIVTTGSGIGPCMSLLNGRPLHGTAWKCRVLWATKSPVKTYGQALVDDVRRADPNARIVDTGTEGRPDMVELAWNLYKDKTDYRASWRSGASQFPQRDDEGPEAVIVISNPKVTRKVVYGLESRGVPAYGVIFDS